MGIVGLATAKHKHDNRCEATKKMMQSLSMIKK